MKLTTEQIQEFYHRGYIKIPGAIPKATVDKARQAINHSLGAVGISGENLTNYQGGGFCRDLKGSQLLQDLYAESPVVSLVEGLIGEGNLKTPVGINPVPRFPKSIGENAGEPVGHIDHMGNGKNGKPMNAYRRAFTCFGVIYLGDVPEPYSGNFTVWPGSHFVYEDYFKDVGIEVLSKGQPRIDQPEAPEMITGQAGDLILAHFLVYHGAGPHASPNIRYATISRLHHVDLEINENECFTDIWREFPCVREVMNLDTELQPSD